MSEWIAEYALFAAKLATLVIALGVLIVLVVSLKQRASGQGDDNRLRVVTLNERQRRRRESLRLAGMSPARRRRAHKLLRKQEKARRKGEDDASDELPSRVWVLDFDGDLKASRTPQLAEQVSLLSDELEAGDEVVVRLTSGGGLVHAYGLAAAQLDRLRDAGVQLTVCVDKVAASGGYMMACCAHRLIAAPFAVIGSIGVVAQVPNVHRLLKKHDIDVELLTAGRYKRTLTVLGENTDEGRAKFLDDLQETHDLFKRYVGERRPALEIDRVATGEIWYGRQALEDGLIDEVATSDGYLAARMKEKRVLHVTLEPRHSLLQRLGVGVSMGIERLGDRVIERVEASGWQRR
ncbi:serine protease SohB [Chromohalobacter marismortui]|uniref:Serine protease SohB n=1 Tax=Chromohalobacter marismortui TaxID=42055 RepID=A0A4R7NPP1_9GAMM|nr:MULTISPECIES: protease SohB [Chromohalobacter]MCI0508879.1 protease SohB [Chromohalobacter sp.]MCI0594264.1 protease SohB [Chromohalobacter sp.]TDU22747.1 serine protease SohB [Chromohalobacter marismortui]